MVFKDMRREGVSHNAVSVWIVQKAWNASFVGPRVHEVAVKNGVEGSISPWKFTKTTFYQYMASSKYKVSG